MARVQYPTVAQGRPAGIVSRVIAAAVDVLVVLAVVAAVELGWAALGHLLLGPPGGFPDLGLGGGGILGSAVALVYLAASWGTAGRTVGDHLMGLRVTRRSGARLGPVAAVLRALLYLAFPLGLLWIPVSRRRASVQDLVVDSTVVHDWYGRSRTSAQRPRG
ncbi:RDD family protein [Streptomyces collinus]|uniref:RDD family protein n=1 Tax=Streptomyces collinus TaxID=42684 RepID=UPI002943A6A1|nr:RDD family protein [Streptomyces collinus]